MKKEEDQYAKSDINPPPKPKPRLGSFRKFYTRSLQLPSPRFKHSLSKSKTFIDDFLIEKIQKLAPSKLTKQFSKRQSKTQKLKTQKQELLNHQSTKHSQLIQKFRQKSLQLSRQAGIAEYRVKKNSGKIKKHEYTFDIKDIKWAEKKWESTQRRGKYSEKLHPICLVYQSEVEQVLANIGKQFNPFEGYQHIQFL